MTDKPEAAIAESGVTAPAVAPPLPPRPTASQCISTSPCGESWYEEHRIDEPYQMTLLPLAAWGYKQDGTVVGLRVAGVDAPEGYYFRGYVLGRQVYDYEMHPVMGPDGKPTGAQQPKAITYDHLFMRFQLEYIKQFKEQQALREKAQAEAQAEAQAKAGTPAEE